MTLDYLLGLSVVTRILVRWRRRVREKVMCKRKQEVERCVQELRSVHSLLGWSEEGLSSWTVTEQVQLKVLNLW